MKRDCTSVLSLVTAVLLALVATAPTQGGVLLYQPYDSSATAIINHEMPDQQQVSTYIVDDIVVPASGWTINSITEWFTASSSWPGSATGRLNIFSKTGSLPLPSDDPTAGSVHPITLTDIGGDYEITMSGLNINLAPGDYWIGFAPIVDRTVNGQNWHYPTATTTGDLAALRNMTDYWGYGTDWLTIESMGYSYPDASLLIEGTAGNVIPVPSSILLGSIGLGLLSRVRRRRKH